MTTIIFEPVDWWRTDSEQQAAYRNCDFCDQNASDDAVAGMRICNFRQFARIVGGDDDGLVICEHCMEKRQ